MPSGACEVSRDDAIPYVSGCSQCQALSINGMPTHEHGCPNIVPTCKECGGLDPDRTCCTSADGEDDTVPLCALAMKCLCAAHAKGRDAAGPCDANEDVEP